MRFSWDENKRRKLILERGIDFEDVMHIWDGIVFEKRDPRDYGGEERRIAMGAVDGRIHVVVYTMRDGIRHLITAWKANKRDQRTYRQGIAGIEESEE